MIADNELAKLVEESNRMFKRLLSKKCISVVSFA